MQGCTIAFSLWRQDAHTCPEISLKCGWRTACKSIRPMLRKTCLALVLAVAGCVGGSGETSPEPAPVDTRPPVVEEMPDPGTVLGREPPPDERGPAKKPPTAVTGHGFVEIRTVAGDTAYVSAAFWEGADPGEGLDQDGCRKGPAPVAIDPKQSHSAGDVFAMGPTPSWLIEHGGPFVGYGTTELSPGAWNTQIVSALGAAVPGFTAPMKPVPEPQITTSLDAGITAGAPFDVAWKPIGNASRVAVSIQGAGESVVCLADASAGHLLFPASRLAQVQPTTFGGCTSCVKLAVEGRSQVDSQAGAYSIALRNAHAVTAVVAVQPPAR